MEQTKKTFREWQSEERWKRDRDAESRQSSTQFRTSESTLPLSHRGADKGAKLQANPNIEASPGFYDLIEDRYITEREVWEDIIRQWKQNRIQQIVDEMKRLLLNDEEFLEVATEATRQRLEEQGVEIEYEDEEIEDDLDD